jgi:hypothetical protein
LIAFATNRRKRELRGGFVRFRTELSEIGSPPAKEFWSFVSMWAPGTGFTADGMEKH